MSAIVCEAEVAARPGDRGLFLALAPMDGITEAAYRDVLTALAGGRSGISVCVSEFVRVTRSPVVASVLRREVPELDQGGRTRAGVPVFVQLLGGEPGPMATSAALACELGALGIDLNFGCPAKTVERSDGGAVLLKAPCRVEAVVRAVRDAVPPERPVTAKIRLGWDSAEGVEVLAQAAEAGGASWLTVHGRTKTQLYRPPVDWCAIGRARQAVKMPVVANGDLTTVQAVARCHEESGCQAFMIGRAAMADPYLFRRLRGLESPNVTPQAIATMLLDYVDTLAQNGASPRAALCRVKQWLRFASQAGDDLARLFGELKVAEELGPVVDRLQVTTGASC